MPEFAHPLVLLLLIPLAGGLIWRWLSRPPAIAVSSTPFFSGQAERKSSRFLTPRHALLFLEAAAAVLLILALARPQIGIEITPMTREGTDIMLVLDYSNSMDAFDPESGKSEAEIREAIREGELTDRLAVARIQIARFIKARPGDRIGIVIFGHLSFTVCPPTLDHDYLIKQTELLTNSLLNTSERGTNIAAGLSAAVNALLDHGDGRRTIVLITDGDNTVNDPLFTPQEAAKLARNKNIAVHTVGIGSDNPFTLRPMPTIRFDTRTLEQIADTARGHFFRAKDIAGFEAVMNTIDQLETTTRVRPALIFMRDLFPGILAAGGLALLSAFVLRHTLLFEMS
jgi:Ca-activated chloride channel family protein